MPPTLCIQRAFHYPPPRNAPPVDVICYGHALIIIMQKLLFHHRSYARILSVFFPIKEYLEFHSFSLELRRRQSLPRAYVKLCGIISYDPPPCYMVQGVPLISNRNIYLYNSDTRTCNNRKSHGE